MKELFPFFDYWMPHSHCVYSNPYIIAFDTFGGVLTGAAYMLIPMLLARVIVAVWSLLTQASKMLIMHAGLFIFCCGTTHFLDVWNWWHNDYHVAALSKAITGGISVAFVWRLFRFIRGSEWQTPD